MELFIGCDAHKKFSVFVVVDKKGQAGKPIRVPHDQESILKWAPELRQAVKSVVTVR